MSGARTARRTDQRWGVAGHRFERSTTEPRFDRGDRAGSRADSRRSLRSRTSRAGKPDPQVFLVAAKRAASIQRIRSCSRTPRWIQAAKAAGMRAVGGVTDSPRRRFGMLGADEVVDNLQGYDVPLLIERLRSSANGDPCRGAIRDRRAAVSTRGVSAGRRPWTTPLPI